MNNLGLQSAVQATEDYKRLEQQVTSELCTLLNCNIFEISYTLLEKLIQQKLSLWNPNNINNSIKRGMFQEFFNRLKNAWENYKLLNFEIDVILSSEEEQKLETQLFQKNMDEYVNHTGYFEDYPDFVKPFFRSDNCRRAGKSILICIPYKFWNDSFYKIFLDNFFSCEHFSVFKYESVIVLTYVFVTEHRLFDLKKRLGLIMEAFKLKFVIRYGKLLEALVIKCGKPIKEFGQFFKLTVRSPDIKSFSSYLIINYAKQHDTTNVYDLMASYAHFAERECSNTTEEHKEDHENHFENAQIFVHLHDQKRFAKNAVENVKAQQFMDNKLQTNKKHFRLKIVDLSYDLYSKEKHFEKCVFHAMFFMKCICYDSETEKIYKKCFEYILQSFTESKTKKRYTALIGPYNCGKTSIGWSFLKLFSGVTINCNIDFGRIGFFLGESINQRFVMFDDVSIKGMNNLDQLRDHLDGRVMVQLEKKNVQPIMQLFPPGIITSNAKLLDSLSVRVNEFQLQPFTLDRHDYKINSDVLFLILTMWNLIPSEFFIWDGINKYKHHWEVNHVPNCDLCRNYCNL